MIRNSYKEVVAVKKELLKAFPNRDIVIIKDSQRGYILFDRCFGELYIKKKDKEDR